MAELTVATYDQIVTLLSKLATNYSNLFVDYETLFYSDTPADVTIQIYNAAGELETFTIPNRAKDRRYILNGNGSPEGVTSASKGSIYQDLTNGALYLKQVGDDSQGWYLLLTENTLADKLRMGSGSPEGVETASLGTLYVDKTNSVLYVKSTSTGNDGWILISANTSILASVNLDNLSSTGEAHFANPSLSNLNTVGQSLINSKENVGNKVTTLSSASTNTQYPSAKVVYDNLTSLDNKLATRNLDNLTATGEEHFLGKPQMRDCILYAPNGLLTNADNVISIPSATVLLGANGVNTDYTNKLSRTALSSSLSVSVSYTDAQRAVVFFKFTKDTEVNSLVYCQEEAYSRSTTAPTGYTTMVWYNPDSNVYKMTTDSGTIWTEYVMTEVARFTTGSTGSISDFYSYHPITVSTQDDRATDMRKLLYNMYDTIYPVGSVYIGIMSECPIASVIGTWELVSSGRVLQGADDDHEAGTTIAAGLPNLYGAFHNATNYAWMDVSGVFKNSYASGSRHQGGEDTGYQAVFNAQAYNSTYGNSTTVQPPAYVVNIWKRTA